MADWIIFRNLLSIVITEHTYICIHTHPTQQNQSNFFLCLLPKLKQVCNNTKICNTKLNSTFTQKTIAVRNDQINEKQARQNFSGRILRIK